MMSRQEFFARARGSMPEAHSTEQLYLAYEIYLTCPLSPFREGQDLVQADCSRCGRCCRRPWRVEAGLQDIMRWADEGRLDILASLVLRPKEAADRGRYDPTALSQLAGKLAGLDEGALAMVLSIARATALEEGSYDLPQSHGCMFLIEGVITACGIYDTRPEICKLFPAIW